MADPISRQIRTIRQLVGKPIRAYHGSPHSFSRFDASKIGTGEGAQAYGHGLYFAGNEAVAKDYRDRLKGMVDAPIPDALGDELQGVIKEIRRLAELRSAAKGDEWYRLDKLLEDLHAQHQDVQRRIREASYNPGHMYEVELGVPESAMLDWDAPMSRQPKVVQKAFGDMAMDMPGDGGRVYRDIATRRGEEFDEDMTGVLADRAASQELLAEGIPGIRYLDAGSRSAGEGTRNYVMFPGTEDRIRILRKYGLLAPMALPALQGEE